MDRSHAGALLLRGGGYPPGTERREFDPSIRVNQLHGVRDVVAPYCPKPDHRARESDRCVAGLGRNQLRAARSSVCVRQRIHKRYKHRPTPSFPRRLRAARCLPLANGVHAVGLLHRTGGVGSQHDRWVPSSTLISLSLHFSLFSLFSLFLCCFPLSFGPHRMLVRSKWDGGGYGSHIICPS